MISTPSPHEIVRGRLSISLGEQGAWISPSKVIVRDLNTVIPIEVYNGKNRHGVFTIGSRDPDFTEQGYEKLSGNDAVQMTISHQTLEIPSKESREFLVELTGAKLLQREAWVSVNAGGLSGIRLELVLRILIDTRH